MSSATVTAIIEAALLNADAVFAGSDMSMSKSLKVTVGEECRHPSAFGFQPAA